MGIISGSQVFLQQHPDGSLVINPVSESSPVQKKERDITGKMGDALTREIIAAYLAGFNIIEFKSKRIMAEQKNIIRDVCYKLIGPEIIEETSKSVIIQDLLNPSEVSIKKSVKRMFLISNSMHKDAIRALKTKDSDLAMDVIHRDDEVDRLFLLISKQFRAVLRGAQLPDTAETSIDEYHDFRMTAAPLERIADHARKIAKIAYNMDFSIKQDSLDLIENASNTARKIVENSIDALYESNVELANQVIDQGEQMREQVTKINETLLKIDSHEAIVSLGTVADSIDRIGDYGANIAEIAINSAMSKALKEQD